MTDIQKIRADKIMTQLILHNTGRSNKISPNEVALIVGICCADPARRVREIVSEMRKDGKPICNDNRGGLYLAANRDEAEEYIARQKKHALSEFVSVKGVVKGLNNIFGSPENQLSLGFEINELS